MSADVADEFEDSLFGRLVTTTKPGRI